jgi:DNA-binding NarL/FixJ family response regulator
MMVSPVRYLLDNAMPSGCGFFIDLFADEAYFIRQFSSQTKERFPPMPPRITARDEACIHLVKKGMKNKEIATQLKLVEGSVKNRLRKIFSILDIESRLELIKLDLPSLEDKEEQGKEVQEKQIPAGFLRLTAKEKEIAVLKANRIGNKEIAERLNTTVWMIKSYCTRIYDKMGVASVAELAVMLNGVDFKPEPPGYTA